MFVANDIAPDEKGGRPWAIPPRPIASMRVASPMRYARDSVVGSITRMATVEREWQAARAWLYAALRGTAPS